MDKETVLRLENQWLREELQLMQWRLNAVQQEQEWRETLAA